MAESQAVSNRDSVGHPNGVLEGTPFWIQQRPPSQAGRRLGPQQNGQVVWQPRQGAFSLLTNPLPQGQDSYHPAGSIGHQQQQQQQQQQAPTITALSQTQPVRYNSLAEAVAARDWGTAARLDILEKNASLREKDASLREKDASLREKDALLREKDALLLEKEESWGGRYRMLHHEKQQIEEQLALGMQALESQHTADLTHLRLAHAENLKLEEKARLVVVGQLDKAIADRKAETSALIRCEKDRQTEVDKNLDLAKKYAEAKHWKSELESMVHSHNHTLRKRDIALAENDTAIEDLRKACNVLQEQLKWAESRNVDLTQEKVTAVKEAKKKVEDKSKRSETTLEQEIADLKAQVEQLQQDLQVAREAQEEAQDGYAAAQQRLEECREIQLAEDEIKTHRKRLLDGDSIAAPTPKKPRVSTETRPPKTPTPKTGQEAVLPTPAPAVTTPHIEIALKNANSLLPPPPPGPSNQARRPAMPQSPKRPTEFVEPLTPVASWTASPPQPTMRNKNSPLPALPLNSSGKHRPPEDTRY